jgi:hypothetical protein
MNAAILLPATLFVFAADLLLLAEGDNVDLGSRYPGVHKIILRGFAASIAECNIVFSRAAFVAKPLDLQLVAGMLPKDLASSFESPLRVLMASLRRVCAS